MRSDSWQQICLPDDAQGEAWELLHENSKTNRHDAFPTEAGIVSRMEGLYESFPYEGYPEVQLPTTRTELSASTGDVLTNRVTSRGLTPRPLSTEKLGTMLFNMYGVTRDNADNDYPRPFRVAPSGGGLYPLEIYFHATLVDELRSGLYHYDPTRHSVRYLRDRDESLLISRFLVQSEFATNASVVFFFTAVFERSTFKYDNRGYRFVLIEAGHVAQNLLLTATAMNLGAVPIGGFFDREADEYLGIDGLRHSTVYMAAIGGDADRIASTFDPESPPI